MIKIIEENNYYFIANYVDYGFTEDGTCGIKIDYRLGNILKIDNAIIHSEFENKYNATWDNHYNQTLAGFYKLVIGFKDKKDAQKALEWINSLVMLNKLG